MSLNPKVCTACRTTFACGLAADGDNCWCRRFPLAREGCAERCPTCLAEHSTKYVAELQQNHSAEELIVLAAPFRRFSGFALGLDYTVENGLYIFSSWYLLKRGYCCGNGCRHCPYGNAPQ